MTGPYRLAAGGAIDRSRVLAFTFDGRLYHGHPGDSLGSALLANGVQVVARSFKYHRPRGVVSAGPEEPNALVTLRNGGRREANVPATMVEIFEGLEASSQNCWPSAAFDIGAVNGLLAPLLKAGFYYKTFMWPPAAWERLYEPLIRRAAGLGRIATQSDPDRYEMVHAHCDVLVVGAGRSGREAALQAGKAGRRVILADQDFAPIEDLGPEVNALARMTVFGLYDHGVAGAVERVADHLAEPSPGGVRQRQWVIRAEEIVLATGTVEQLPVFPGNDRPGVMLASAAARYATRFGVACGRRAVVLAGGGEAEASVDVLKAAGVAVAAVLDARRGDAVMRAIGAPVRAVDVRRDGRTERIAADLLCVSGGFAPQVQLALMGRGDRRVRLVGRAAQDLSPPLLAEASGGFSFVDLQNDVTADDVRLAHREGYSHVEHMKRYTTHGMATDQGRIGGLAGSGVLAQARGETMAAVGTPTARPFVSPVAWGTLAGAEVGDHFRPERRLPLHGWHAANGATFVKLALWLRPLVYADDSSWAPVLEEARTVRGAVGLSDVSSLGKIDVQGAGAATFLERIYANRIGTIPVGRARYGLMLREDGMVFDDGTVARLSPRHFFVSTTTANAASVLEHMEFHHETCWPDLDVRLTSVADQWAQFAVAGPMSRSVLTGLVDRDISGQAFPFMAAAETTIAGVPGRLFRISFSGELAYEVSVPAHHALPVWEAILDRGAPFGIRPYGLDALNLLRIEQGHVAGSEINGQTTARDLGLGRLLKAEGGFVGHRLAQRRGLEDPGRPALVGVRALDPASRLKAGALLVREEGSRDSLGFVTAACPRSEGEGFIGLALVEGGSARLGEVLHAADPVRGQFCDVEVVSQHFVDPRNERVKDARVASPPVPTGPAGRAWAGGAAGDEWIVSAAQGTQAGVSLRRVARDVVELFPFSRDAMTSAADVVLPIAPSRAVIVRARSAPGALACAVAAAYPEAAVVDQSGAFAGFRLSGEKARWVLAKICRLDLHPRSFRQHEVARTIIAQIPVIVYCLDAGASVFDLLVPATLARSFTHALASSAADVGCAFEDDLQ